MREKGGPATLKGKGGRSRLSPAPPCCLEERLRRRSVAVSAMRGLLGFFSTSSKLSPVDGGGQHYVAVCVRKRELGQMIALNRVPVAVGCCFHGDIPFLRGVSQGLRCRHSLPLALN